MSSIIKDCQYYDSENDCCKTFSDYGAEPTFEPCTCAICPFICVACGKNPMAKDSMLCAECERKAGNETNP